MTAKRELGRKPSVKRIAVLVGVGSGHERGVLMGVHRFARPMKPWVFRTHIPGPGAVETAMAWKPHGIIAQTNEPTMAEGLTRLSIPVVSVSDSLPDVNLPCIVSDNRAVGHLAATHFIDKGFQNFAYFGQTETPYSTKREVAYRERLREHGFDCHVLCHSKSEHILDDWEETSDKLAKWLTDLPKPTAVFASHDKYCLILAETCRECDIAVPEEIALLGVDNDELLCNRVYPPFSSVRTDVDLIGYEAAKLLGHLMEGRKPAAGEKLIAPLGIETRQSSDILAISDPDVAAAVEFIKNHATKRITVRDVVPVVGVCRRVLERRFRRRLERSILDEIHRVRIERAQELLVNTSMPVPEVARASGFRDGYHLWSTFRKKRGTSPADFRRRSQPR